MQEAVARLLANTALTKPRPIAAAILAELRRRGAWLPGDAVTPAMTDAAWHAVRHYGKRGTADCRYIDNHMGQYMHWLEMGQAIIAALAARGDGRGTT